jgi:hypothetical protein
MMDSQDYGFGAGFDMNDYNTTYDSHEYWTSPTMNNIDYEVQYGGMAQRSQWMEDDRFVGPQESLNMRPMQRYIQGSDALPFFPETSLDNLESYRQQISPFSSREQSYLRTDIDSAQQAAFDRSTSPGTDSCFSRSSISGSPSDDALILKNPVFSPEVNFDGDFSDSWMTSIGGAILQSDTHIESPTSHCISLSQVLFNEESAEREHQEYDDSIDAEGDAELDEIVLASACSPHEDMEVSIDALEHDHKDVDEDDEDDCNDSEFKPSRATRQTRRRESASPTKSRRHSRTVSSISTPASVSTGNGLFKRKSKSKVTSKTNAERFFPCPFTKYGCRSNFASKNEWKRHVSTQHIKLGFWRCGLCPISSDPMHPNYNDFNRKDLFTQHCRRMHSHYPDQEPDRVDMMGEDGETKDKKVLSDDVVLELQTNYYRELRTNPPSSKCLFCQKDFVGEKAWDERMEHVATHLEKFKRSRSKVPDPDRWTEDDDLRDWYEQEGLIEKDAKGGWKLADGIPKRENPYTALPDMHTRKWQ